MAKVKTSYICQECGSVYSRWSGHCAACDSWNTITEEKQETGNIPKGLSRHKGNVIDFVPLQGIAEKQPRRITENQELDRVTGGGFVPGSALLIGGDPGIGKSTLLLQTVCQLADKGMNCVYISGEEAVDQVRLRAERMGVSTSPVHLASATSLRDIITTLESPVNGKPVDIAIIDSIQTMYIDNIESAPGTVTQVRTCSHELITLAKKRGIIMILVGHVTKDGAIAGPRVLEHMVDTVLYFEGDRGHQFRILRAVKNRFGPTNEIGVFEMSDKGLEEVRNPSELFLSERRDNVSGSAVLAGMEGTRPVLVEIQALVAPTSFAAPRRAVIGWDTNRLAMLLAVLETRCGLRFGQHDVYLNIAGGLKINEPAADLAVAAAIISAVKDIPLPHEFVFFGEVGLAGEIRGVGQFDMRLKEAQKLGFKQAFLPTLKKKSDAPGSLKIHEVAHLSNLVPIIDGLGR